MHSDDTQAMALWRRWWLADRRAESTINQYRSELDRLAAGTEQPLLELSRLEIEDFILQRGEVGSATGRMAFRAVRSFYKFAHSRDMIDPDPTKPIGTPREILNPTPATATAEHVEQLIAAMDLTDPLAVRDAALITVLFATGMRRSEALRNTVDHLDIDAQTMLVPLSKTGVSRTVALSDLASERLLAWLEIRLSWRPAHREIWLSRTRDGGSKPLTSNGARLMFERRTRTADVDLNGLHALRRGFVVHQLSNGVSQVSVERLGGWRAGSSQVSNYSRSLGAELAVREYRRANGNGAA